jgi:3',5'-cyclic AMP phosphodiesterase CpdA
MKIAHISDLHLCGKFKRENIAKTKKLIKYALDRGADHFVFTGDISDNAQQNDFLILRKILQTYKLLSADKSTVIIGNHDIFGGVQTAQDILKFTDKCANTNFQEKVKKFYEYFEELFDNVFFADDENPFPFAKEIGNIILIGLNSIEKYSKLKNTFASNGYVSKHQRENLQKIFDANRFADKIKIIMVHHHFSKNDDEAKSSEKTLWNRIENYTMKLRRKKKLIKQFVKNDVKLVLHGHSHEFKEYCRKGIKFINAGASVDNQIEDESGLYLIDIDGKNIRTNLELLRHECILQAVETGNKIMIPALAQ